MAILLFEHKGNDDGSAIERLKGLIAAVSYGILHT